MSEIRKSPARLILMIVGPLVLIGGGVVGAALFGVINVPGLTPAKKAKATAGAHELYADVPTPKEPAPAAKRVKPPVPKPEPPKPDLESGAKQVAKLWNGMPTKSLLAVIKEWSDEDLARVLRKMDTDKAVELLAALDPKRASALSLLIQNQTALAIAQPTGG
ncbi:MAG TPA: hypothetical protein PLL78_01720 [Fimbriimonadaceae bacterium]|nr:hypothetical protein [Fimbriimonadaceae bacterium]HRJ95375.1 hypothetical protein [Fimbriimonadaceae bacterium]